MHLWVSIVCSCQWSENGIIISHLVQEQYHPLDAEPILKLNRVEPYWWLFTSSSIFMNTYLELNKLQIEKSGEMNAEKLVYMLYLNSIISLSCTFSMLDTPNGNRI